jgi:hypothetical protein
MSATDRQNRLLVAEDWKRVYQSFRNADFQSYDFENLRRTMIDYIRQNYPEDYNDYIESSEYLALIDLIAFLGQSIAFRVDLNARENFLELAERRESVLRLARMISYNAKRNIPAYGLLKFSTVQTTQNVLDSNGRNLSGQVITWNDPSNNNWYDQFVRIINAAMSTTQQFGNPINKATIYGIPTEQYRFQGSNTDVPVYGFNKSVAGRSMNFEITSTTFAGKDYIYEETPKIGNKLGFVYRDDGRGASSRGTGFFLNFTQGTLNTGTFTIDQPSKNESVDIDSTNINDSDVWLYRLDQNGVESEEWTKVSSFEGNNVIYNSLSKNIRNIYGVVTRASDAISLAFSDGTFGNLPLGTFRVYYRISNGLTYTVNPQDIRSVSIVVPYTSAQGQAESLTISLTLATSVSTAETTETNESIKANAPATYYTQNRMITSEDYNISPLSVSQQVAKVKSVNRTSSGISRYFDLIDPTGKYSSTNLFANDGVLFREDYTVETRFSYANKTDIEAVIYNTVFDILDRTTLKNFYYSNYAIAITESFGEAVWNRATTDANYSTGWIGSATPNTPAQTLGSYTQTDLQYVTPGSLLRFEAPTGYYFDTNNNNDFTTTSALGTTKYIWAEVVSVADNGTGLANTGKLSTGIGAVALNRVIPSPITSIGGATITNIIPKWRTVIDDNVITTMIDLVFANKPFGLRYDRTAKQWKIIVEANLDAFSTFSLGKESDKSNQRQDASWLLLFTTDNEFYTITSREQRYIFESDKQIRFYFDRSNKIFDSRTNTIIKDVINVLSINHLPRLDTQAYTRDMQWDIVSEFTGLDGYVDTKKLVITFADSDDNGVVDDPELFVNIVDPILSDASSYIIQEKYAISAGQEDYRYVSNKDDLVKILDTQDSAYPLTQWTDGQYFYFIDTQLVVKLNKLLATPFVPTLDYKVYLGRDDLKFQYTHSADYESRIDPGVSNIIDVFVLTKGYDTKFRQWLSGANITKPLAPSTDELHNTIAPSLNLIKSVSDEIVYHPVNYKVLFGPSADTDVQATFKIIKNPGQVLSDNDIKARALTAINQFFALENWDFGDTFYFTELSTYVMNQLAPDITNFVIVPKQVGLNFGSLFEIKSASDQLFINGATVDDIEIISGITSSAIKSVSGTETVSTTTVQQNITSSPYGATNG